MGHTLTGVVILGSDGHATLLSQGFGSNAGFVAVFLDLRRYQRSTYCSDSHVLALDALPQASHKEQHGWCSLIKSNLLSSGLQVIVLLSVAIMMGFAIQNILLLLNAMASKAVPHNLVVGCSEQCRDISYVKAL
jgi:hypothetical protein